MHQLHLRHGNVEQGIALRRQLVQPRARRDHQVAGLHPRHQLGIGGQAQIAGIIGMQRIKQMRAAERGADRHAETFGEAGDLRAAPSSLQRPPPRISHGAGGFGQQFLQRRHLLACPARFPRLPQTAHPAIAMPMATCHAAATAPPDPGAPPCAAEKARATISAMRSGSFTSATHLAMPPKKAR